jgi:hypothetical protein
MASHSVVRAIASAALLALLAPATTAAQEGTRAPVTHQQVVSTNPFGLMFEWFNAEYERKATRSSTWGLSGSLFSLDGGDVDYANGAFFFRYYPQGAALTGFYVGGRAGIHRASADRESAVFYGLGFEIGYNWLLGASRKFSVGIGVGATRLFGNDLDGVSLTIPTVRLVNIGVAF